ncbi:DUF89 family protein [candidate division WOR-3 bacterium]|nr:DUF89 family protein [candidate division WOR-3 bacterium]
MRTYLDCIPCFLKQALWASRIITNDEKKIKEILDEIGMMVKDIPLNSSPPETGRLVYKKIREMLGVPDPFKKIKEKYTKIALKLYPFLKKEIEESKDRLLTAIRLSIAGNVIDFGADREFELEKEIYEILKKEKKFAICDYNKFKEHLASTDEILYIGDNAGETVFDRILIEEMNPALVHKGGVNKPTTFVVREKPVINDATREDAVEAGLSQVATILSSGTDAPGVVLKTTNKEFRKVYNNAKFIISKGQGNYEALSEEKRPIFFLLKIKCPVIAKDIGLKDGDIVLKGINI